MVSMTTVLIVVMIMAAQTVLVMRGMVTMVKVTMIMFVTIAIKFDDHGENESMTIMIMDITMILKGDSSGFFLVKIMINSYFTIIKLIFYHY